MSESDSQAVAPSIPWSGVKSTDDQPSVSFAWLLTMLHIGLAYIKPQHCHTPSASWQNPMYLYANCNDSDLTAHPRLCNQRTGHLLVIHIHSLWV